MWEHLEYSRCLPILIGGHMGGMTGAPGKPLTGPSSHSLSIALTQADLKLVANSALEPEI